jgi:error-prone DNA polymerase
MAMTVAGFSGGEAEELRRAMGFKRSTLRMEKLERRLREGMARNAIVGEAADRIVRSITSFALYGFPESHAASFALIAYASAYLKCHHPAVFLAAMLNCYPLGFYHPATLVKDGQRHGVAVRPIDVAQSDWNCTLEAGAVRLGFKYIAGLCEETGQRIMDERRRAPFAAIADFAARVAPNRRELDAIAYAGGFASFGLKRRDALWQAAAAERDPHSLLAGLAPPDTGDAMRNNEPDDSAGGESSGSFPAMRPIEETLADHAATGVTVGPHLMAHLRRRLRARRILSAAELASASDGEWVKAAGVVIVRQRPGTARGFLFVTLEDETGIANVIVTPDLFQANRTLLHRAVLLIVEGPLQRQQGVTHVRGRRFREIRLHGATGQSHDFH